MFNGFDKIVLGSLGLGEPWYMIGMEFKQEEPAIHVYIGIREDAEIACPRCGGQAKRYGYEPRERVWRHGDCMFYPTLVHCKRPRIVCDQCGVQQINAPFERKNSRFTLMFEGYAMLLMADMPRSKVSQVLRCNEKSLVNIISYWVKKAVDERSLAEVTGLAIDETSFKKGHRYVTVVIDSAKRRVIDVEENRTKETVGKVVEMLEKHDCKPENIVTVTSDMSRSYMPAIAEYFPNAVNIIDKFHVKQLLLNALEAVRKDEQKHSKGKQALFRGRKLFMVPHGKMTDVQEKKLIELSKAYPKTGRAYRIVESLDSFYACTTLEEAAVALDGLYSWMRRSRLQPMKDAAKSLKRNRANILAYFTYRLTNAICEGINSMIQAAKRKARGYHTFSGFSSMIYLVAGKLVLAVPMPF